MAILLARDYLWIPSAVTTRGAAAVEPTPNPVPPTVNPMPPGPLPPERQTDADLVPADLPGVALRTTNLATMPPTDKPAAIIGEAVVTTRQLEESLGSRLVAMRAQEYDVTRRLLEQSIDRMLVQRAAAARQLSVAEFLRQEIGDVESASAEEIGRALSAAGEQLKAVPEADAKRVAAGRLQAATVQERVQGLLSKLRAAEGGVRILLEPPRAALEVDEERYPTRGPRTAPVTLVEFSDFQCPFCARSQETLRELEERYPGKLRFVFRHFPLDSHRDASQAAEAAECAGDAGKFWEMHDLLFATARFGGDTLQQHAGTLGLDAETFDQCVSSRAKASIWQRDKQAGESLGITSTPTFFVNGRVVMGALPLSSFARVIDEELARINGRMDAGQSVVLSEGTGASR
jgi:protein-disulfide isomerase